MSATPPPDSPSPSAWRRLASTGRTKRVLLVCALGAAAVAATAALLHSGIPLGVRVALGVPLVLLAPGYALKRAIFPARPGGWPESAALILGLSLVATVLVTLALNLLPWGLSATSWATGIGSVTVTAAAVAAHRTPQAPVTAHQASRAYVWPRLLRLDGRRLPRRVRSRDLVLLILAAWVVGGAMTLAFHPLGPPPSAHGYTQLWLVRHGPTVQVGVACFEHGPTRYLVEVLQRGKLEDRYQMALNPDQRWVTSLPGGPGVVEARLWLELPGSKPTVYRDVHLAPGAST